MANISVLVRDSSLFLSKETQSNRKKMEERKRILIVGGSGYLGQHLLSHLRKSDASYLLAFTHRCAIPPQALIDTIPTVRSFPIDLRSGAGFDVIYASFGQPDVIVNCAAISVPRACELDPEVAMAVNVPTSLVKWINSFGIQKTLLIHLSTDQVYQGVKSFYKEDDETIPVNMYGKSKVAAENYITENCSNFAILRSSIIYGPQTTSPVEKSLPVQWINSVLAGGTETEFFHDEYRCPVFVKDAVNVISTLLVKWISGVSQMKLLLNVGGPDRLSRAQMAETVADVMGFSRSLIKAVPASSVNRGVISPADISMDISKLIQVLGFTTTSYNEGVRSTLGGS